MSNYVGGAPIHRLFVPLARVILDELGRQARAAHRHPTEHAAYLIEQGLIAEAQSDSQAEGTAIQAYWDAMRKVRKGNKGTVPVAPGPGEG